MIKPEPLNWSLVIATYRREAILPRCLQLAAQQTVPPTEIIVVDASPNWETTQTRIMQDVAPQYPAIDWKYVQAKRTSLTSQRNQGIDLAGSDILFLIDDDSFMYPDCAEEVMQVYSQDITHQVVGIMPRWEALPPDRLSNSSKPPSSNFSKTIKAFQFRLTELVSQLFTYHVPSYDFPRPKHTLPETITQLAIEPVPNLLGFAMTFRRELFEQIRFEEMLEAYSASEDIDISYRAIRRGILLRASKARIYHMQAPGGRLSRVTVAALKAFNTAALHCLYNSDLNRFKKMYPQLLWERLIKVTFRDILTGRLSLPSTRGVWFAFRHYQEIFSKNPDELRTWYPKFQREIITHLNKP